MRTFWLSSSSQLGRKLVERVTVHSLLLNICHMKGESQGPFLLEPTRVESTEGRGAVRPSGHLREKKLLPELERQTHLGREVREGEYQSFRRMQGKKRAKAALM